MIQLLTLFLGLVGGPRDLRLAVADEVAAVAVDIPVKVWQIGTE